jgi:hypothetical protein
VGIYGFIVIIIIYANVIVMGATPVAKRHITGLFTLRRFAAWAAPHSSYLNFAILRIAFYKVAETS